MPHPTLWINDPGAAPLAQLTRWPTLYDITDDWAAADRKPTELQRIRTAEQWLLRNAQTVVACSPNWCGASPTSGTARSNSSPTRSMSPRIAPRQPRPADLPPVAAVYVGTLHTDRLDVALCEATAAALGGDGSVDTGRPERA